MKTRYLLKKRGNTKGATHPIYIALYEGDTTELIYTGQRITLKEWSPNDRLPKDQKGETYKAIEKVREGINRAKVRLEADDQPITPFTVKQAYEALTKQKESAQHSKDKIAKAGLRTVYSLAKQYKDALPDKFSQATKKTVKISIDQFTQYLENTTQRSVELKDLNQDLIDSYSKYLLDKRKLSDSTLNKRMKHLNWFLRSINYQASIVPRKLKKKAIIALTVAELRALESVDVTKHKNTESHEYLQRAKDMFLLGCYSALRISDLKRINPANSSDGFISLTTQKNNEVFRMPIVSQAQAILDKYKGKAPKISEQEVNRSIKIVCELANINKPIEIETTRGGKTVTKTVAKHQVITSHIASKTFITNAKALWDLDPAEVAGIVRKDLKTMLNHYFKAPVESATKKMIAADSTKLKVA